MFRRPAGGPNHVNDQKKVNYNFILGVTSTSLRSHADVSAVSVRISFGFTSDYFDVTSASLRSENWTFMVGGGGGGGGNKSLPNVM